MCSLLAHLSCCNTNIRLHVLGKDITGSSQFSSVRTSIEPPFKKRPDVRVKICHCNFNEYKDDDEDVVDRFVIAPSSVLVAMIYLLFYSWGCQS